MSEWAWNSDIMISVSMHALRGGSASLGNESRTSKVEGHIRGTKDESRILGEICSGF